MQAAPEEPEPIGLILDGEMRGDPNDLIAFATAFGLSTAEEPQARILTLSLTGSSIEGAAFTEAVSRFYTMIALRDFPEEFRRYRGLPIGLDDSGDMSASVPVLANLLARKDAEGGPVYGHQVRELTDTADPAALIRNGLTAREDQSTIVVLNGPATNLARVLSLRGGAELIAAKVKLLVVAMGDLPSSTSDPHVRADVEGARKLFAEWPTSIVTVGTTLGEKLRFPGETMLAGFDWAENHPLVDGYGESPESPRDVSTREAAAILHAVRPEAGYFGRSQPGVISVGEDGGLRFEASLGGKHRYLTFDEAQADHLRQTYVELVTAMPAARELPRFLKKRLEEEKQEELEKKLQKQQQQQ